MKHVRLSRFMSLLLIFTLTFLPSAFGAPDRLLQDPDAPADVPVPEAQPDSPVDLDWSNESALLNQLKTASLENLQTMSDETYQEVLSTAKMVETVAFGIGFLAAGGGGVLLVITLFSKTGSKLPQATVAGALIVGGAAVIMAAMNADNQALARNITVAELKEIVGETLSNKVVALQQLLTQLDQTLDARTIALGVPSGFFQSNFDLKCPTLVLFPEVEDIPMTAVPGGGIHQATQQDSYSYQYSYQYVFLSPQASSAFKVALKKKILEKAFALDFANTTLTNWQSSPHPDILAELRAQTVSFEEVIFRADPRHPTSLYDPPAIAYAQRAYRVNIGELLDNLTQVGPGDAPLIVRPY